MAAERGELDAERSEALRVAFECAPVGVVVTDLLGRILSANPAFCEMLGRREEEVRGMTVADVTHPDDVARSSEQIRRLVSGEVDRFAVDKRYLRADGGTIWVRDLVKVVPNAEGGVRLCGVMFDITEQKEAALERDRTLSLLQSTLDATADGILVVDRDEKITLYNRRFAEMWHLPEEVLAERDDEKAIRWVLDQLQNADAFVRKVRELYDRPEAESFDVLEFRDGRVFERFSRPQYQGGEVVGRVWSFRDATARVRAQEELARTVEEVSRANERLRELDVAKRHFLASVSHELRTPLAAIRGAAENLMEDEEVSGRRRRIVEILHRNVLRLSRLIENLLDMAALETGRFAIRKGRVDLRAPVRAALDALRGLAEVAERKVEVELPDAPLEADADHDRVEQIAANLLENAVRYARSRVHLRLERDRDAAVLVVEDDGPGVAPEEVSRLFTRFVRLDEDGSKGHMGLGLSIVKALAEAHGGRAYFESAEGGGARFVVELPVGGE